MKLFNHVTHLDNNSSWNKKVIFLSRLAAEWRTHSRRVDDMDEGVMRFVKLCRLTNRLDDTGEYLT